MNKRRQKGRAVNGILVLDKPKGLTSNAALQEVKRIFNAAKAGHTGSLDPLATGVLPLCFGEATKISQFLLDSNKRYRTTVRLGLRTDTGDSEGSVIAERDCSGIRRADIERVLKSFEGEIEQMPPMYSALKHQGVPLYKLARQGIEVERSARTIQLHRIALLNFEMPELELDIACSKGTYVRTLADDLGEALGCGAHVTVLRRLQAGAFDEADCVTLDQLKQAREGAEPEDYSPVDCHLIDMDRAVEDFPEVSLPESTAKFIKQGQPVLVRHLPDEGYVRLYEGSRFIGIGSILEDGRVAPRRMIVD